MEKSIVFAARLCYNNKSFESVYDPVSDVQSKYKMEVSILAAVKLILEVLFIIVCIALTVIILMQEGKSAGLGAIAGAADTYWGKNKGRSMEGMLVKLTRVLVVLFIVISAVLNIGSFN